MLVRRTTRALLALGGWVLSLQLFTACHSKVAVVCDKLNGCGLLERSTSECEDSVTRAFASEGVDKEQLTHCVDCLGLKFCDEIRAGRCDEDCGDVFAEMRARGLIGPSVASEDSAAGAGP